MIEEENQAKNLIVNLINLGDATFPNQPLALTLISEAFNQQNKDQGDLLLRCVKHCDALEKQNKEQVKIIHDAAKKITAKNKQIKSFKSQVEGLSVSIEIIKVIIPEKEWDKIPKENRDKIESLK